MKIKFTILVLCVPFLMIMLSSCANMSQNNKKGESKMTSNNSTINVPVPSWENKEEKESESKKDESESKEDEKEEFKEGFKETSSVK